MRNKKIGIFVGSLRKEANNFRFFEKICRCLCRLVQSVKKVIYSFDYIKKDE